MLVLSLSLFSLLRPFVQTVAQHYLRNPLLLDGFKWDLRLYVLVTSFQPLEAFIYREGFVRLSTAKFDLNPAKQV